MLTELDTARSALFAGPDSSALAAVDAAASAAYRYDADAVESLRRRGARAVGLRMVLEAVTVTARADRSVTLNVTDRRLPYELRDQAGRVISRVGGRATARHVIELQNVRRSSRSADQWRVAKVTDAPL